MGQAVAERTILRRFRKDNGELVTYDDLENKVPFKWETWKQVAERVAKGNSLLVPFDQEKEYKNLRDHIAKATILMSGRHLQHGDETQPLRNMEVMTNCFDRTTKILTLEHGPTQISNVVDQKVTVKAADGLWRKATVSSFGIQKLFKYQFAAKTGGRSKTKPIEVIATKNHRWFMENGKIQEGLSIGDVIAPAPDVTGMDHKAVIHGLIFGDGSAHKDRRDNSKRVASQGRSYASIRVCSKDKWEAEIKKHLTKAGYKERTPSWANGDSVFYLGKFPFCKEVPWTTDPEYIAGFIYGWWMADGSKTYNGGNTNRIEISTCSKEACEWLVEHAAYAGYVVSGMGVKTKADAPGRFPNGKTLWCVRLSKTRPHRVVSIEPAGEDEVFCVTEPITSGFTLANGLLTGNCSTAPCTFILFYLLLNGSGVGRCYDDDFIVVNWDHAPSLRCVISEDHPDYDISRHESVRDAKHKYGSGRKVMWFEVPDSREGWAKALEIWERAAFQKVHSDKTLILDFTKIRAAGTPIKGMQNRPASGPVALMNAFEKAATIRGAGLEPWLQAMYIDHYFAECVLVGGARRAARMATKHWSDPSSVQFVKIKRPIEFPDNLNDVLTYRNELQTSGKTPPSPFLWSSNNSITVDDEFWNLVSLKRGASEYTSDRAKLARKVFKEICKCSYGDGTGEPGIINSHKLVANDDGFEDFSRGDFIGGKKFKPGIETQVMLAKLARRAGRKKYRYIVNPCSEIVIHILGAFCVLADVAPYHADSIEEAVDAFRVATRALIRTNTMDSIYNKEVKRTNRIGVGITGIHEFALKFFGYGFRDLIDEEKSKDFWLTIARFSRAVKEEAKEYAEKLGVAVPHTNTTIKPAGTTSKLFGLTEGFHNPSMKEFMRWVQFRSDDHLVEDYRIAGYPTRDLQQYEGTTIVGFPTAPTITQMEGHEKIVVAGDATPEEQYQWLRLGEKYWIHGTDENGVPLTENTGNQISYTLKYKPENLTYEDFKNLVKMNQPTIKCCSVMPQVEVGVYEYQPEQPISKAQFEKFVRAISKELDEDVDKVHIDCESGACPIDFNK